jgi:hypothetical protein
VSAISAHRLTTLEARGPVLDLITLRLCIRKALEVEFHAEGRAPTSVGFLERALAFFAEATDRPPTG